MKEKYYTPELSEVRIGFEYEHWNSNLWAKVKIDSKDDLIYFLIYAEPQIKEDRIRCNFLDREDIESLGWEVDSLASAKFGQWILEATIQNIQEYVIEIYLVCDLRFKGIIKNKSEFKRVMQQLQITK